MYISSDASLVIKTYILFYFYFCILQPTPKCWFQYLFRNMGCFFLKHAVKNAQLNIWTWAPFTGCTESSFSFIERILGMEGRLKEIYCPGGKYFFLLPDALLCYSFSTFDTLWQPSPFPPTSWYNTLAHPNIVVYYCGTLPTTPQNVLYILTALLHLPCGTLLQPSQARRGGN